MKSNPKEVVITGKMVLLAVCLLMLPVIFINLWIGDSVTSFVLIAGTFASLFPLVAVLLDRKKKDE